MVSVSDLGSCLSHRWLGSPESQLHGFPTIPRRLVHNCVFGTHIYTLHSVSLVAFYIHHSCHYMSYVSVLEYLALRALHVLQHHTMPYRFGLLGKFEPCMSSFPWP